MCRLRQPDGRPAPAGHGDGGTPRAGTDARLSPGSGRCRAPDGHGVGTGARGRPSWRGDDHACPRSRRPRSELVAAHLDGRLDPADLGRVEGWLAACGACAVLHADLQDLVLATRALPTPARPRDFALTPDDARRLRSGGWRRLVAAIGSPRDTVSRPLALGLQRWASPASSWPTSHRSRSGVRERGTGPADGAGRALGAPAFMPDSVRPAAGGENPVDTTGEGRGRPLGRGGRDDHEVG